jgi:hypothetical protein
MTLQICAPERVTGALLRGLAGSASPDRLTRGTIGRGIARLDRDKVV